MSKSYVITLRLPEELGRGIERYAARLGSKPAHVSALAVDEFMRRRAFPLIDIRDTAAGRVAYVKGTRLAVYWLVNAVSRMGGNLRKAARVWAIPPEKIRAALHYAATYPEEVQVLREHAEENRAAVQKAEAALAQLKASRKPNLRRRARHRTGG